MFLTSRVADVLRSPCILMFRSRHRRFVDVQNTGIHILLEHSVLVLIRGDEQKKKRGGDEHSNLNHLIPIGCVFLLLDFINIDTRLLLG